MGNGNQTSGNSFIVNFHPHVMMQFSKVIIKGGKIKIKKEKKITTVTTYEDPILKKK